MSVSKFTLWKKAGFSKRAIARHILDHVWRLLEPHLPGRRGVWGGAARDNRRFINAVFWILRTGAPWRDLPPDYGDWKNTHCRFCRWRDSGVGENLLEILIGEPDFTVQREYGKYIYRQRHLAENAFMKLKRWRGIATRHAKNAACRPHSMLGPLARYLVTI